MTTPNTNPVGYVSEKTYSRGDAKQGVQAGVQVETKSKQELREKIGLAIFGGRVLPINWETDSRLERVAELLSDTVNKMLDELAGGAVTINDPMIHEEVQVIPLSAIEQVRKRINNE